MKVKASFKGARLGSLGLAGLLLACLVMVPYRSVAAESFVVIVNAANPVSALSAQDLSKVYMKKSLRWPSGEEILPVDLKDPSATRESFSRQIHDKSTAAVKAYWQKMIFSGRDVPPPEKASNAEVVAFVRANRGAVGYVATDASLGDGVKVIKVVP
jgi:ABC-type phosphate transport system substrate-binding protein